MFFVVVFLFASLAQATELKFFYENDNPFTDRDYTAAGGVFLFLDDITPWSFGATEQIFTPANIRNHYLDPTDRPYAGWFDLIAQRIWRLENSMAVTSLHLGVLGPLSLGGTVQEFVHDIRGFQLPFGWRHQLKNEITLDAQGMWFYPWTSWLALQSEAALGTPYIYVQSSLHLQAGTLKIAPREGLYPLPIALEVSEEIENASDVKFYLGAGYRVTLWNSFVQGSLLVSSPHPGVAQSLGTWVFYLGGELQKKHWSVGYSLNVHSGDLRDVPRWNVINSFQVRLKL